MKNQARNKVHYRNSEGFEEWHEYDGNGNEVHFRNSYGVEGWYEYDGNGNKVHYRNSEGFEVWYEYDGNGNKVHFRNSYGSEVRYEYDGNGNKIYSRNLDGYEVWYEYDGKGNKVHLRGLGGYEEWYKYDGNGNKIYSRNSDGYEEWYEYDGKGNKIYLRNSYGLEEWYEYDGNGNKVHFRNSKGFEEWYEYDGKDVSRQKDGKSVRFENIPEYAVSYLAYGDVSELEEEDVEVMVINEWQRRNNERSSHEDMARVEKIVNEKEKLVDDIIGYFAGFKTECPDAETAIMARYNRKWDRLPCDPEGATKEQERLQDELLERCADEIIAKRKALRDKEKIADEIGIILEDMGLRKEKKDKSKKHERDEGMSL